MGGCPCSKVARIASHLRDVVDIRMILRKLLNSLMAPQPHLWMSRWSLGQDLSVPLGRLFYGWEIWAEGDRKQELWLIYLYPMLGDLLLN